MTNKFSKKASAILSMISDARSEAETLAQQIRNNNPDDTLKKKLIKTIQKIEQQVVKAENDFKTDFMKLYKTFIELGGKSLSGNKLNVISPAYHVNKTTSGFLGGYKFTSNHKNPRISEMDNVIIEFKTIVEKLENNKKIANAQRTSKQIANAEESRRKMEESKRKSNLNNIRQLQKRLNTLQVRTGGTSNSSRFNKIIKPQVNRLRKVGLNKFNLNSLTLNEKNVVRKLITDPTNIDSSYNNRLRNIVNRVLSRQKQD